jgi:PrtD family type I secretion system ABC transporter
MVGFKVFGTHRVLVRIGRSLDESVTVGTYRALALVAHNQKTSGPRDGVQPIRDLDQVRGFLSSVGPTALFDLPWMPLYLGVCFAFHFWIGVTALVGACILIALTVLTEIMSRSPTKEAAVAGSRRLGFAEITRRNAEAIQAMAMSKQFVANWTTVNRKYMEWQQAASDVSNGLGSASRILRMLLQSLVLAVGAYLVINQEATGGIIIASSILVSRALSPVETAIAHWKGFLAARQSWGRLSQIQSANSAIEARTQLPPPKLSLALESLTVTPPGQQKVVVQDVSFRLEAGQGVGVIGPSASGKSSLVRAIVGVWPAVRGKVRIDTAAIDQWDPDELGRHIGYLPQDVELFDGTIAQNIARFDQAVDPQLVVAAATTAGVNEMILRLPEGYDTQVGDFGTRLSAGQRQRIALARALYKDPFIVVLDEPNSNLDSEGDDALTQAILAVRRRGGIVVVVAHRGSALSGVDFVLSIANGRAQAFGPKEEVLQKVLETPRAVPRPIKQRWLFNDRRAGPRCSIEPQASYSRRLPYPRLSHFRTWRMGNYDRAVWGSRLFRSARGRFECKEGSASNGRCCWRASRS